MDFDFGFDLISFYWMGGGWEAFSVVLYTSPSCCIN